MAFVMIATGATSRSRVRTFSVRPLIAIAGVAALALLASGGAVGFWVAELASRSDAAASAPTAATTIAAEPLALPFTLEQVGAISARLFRLESEAAQLSRRIGVLKTDAPAGRGTCAAQRVETPRRRRPARPADRCCRHAASAADLGALDAQLGRIEQPDRVGRARGRASSRSS